MRDAIVVAAWLVLGCGKPHPELLWGGDDDHPGLSQIPSCATACSISGTRLVPHIFDVSGFRCGPDDMLAIEDRRGLEALCGYRGAHVTGAIDFSRYRAVAASPKLELFALPGEVGIAIGVRCGQGTAVKPSARRSRDIEQLLLVPRAAGRPCAWICGGDSCGDPP
jgi:hypothetical protein